MRRFWGMVVIAVVAMSLAGCGAVTRIGDIVEHPDRFMNTQVTVFGAVSNSETLTPLPGQLVKFHGKYALTDQDNKPIIIKTVDQPPANGTEQRLTGKIIKSDEDPVNGFVIEHTGIRWLPEMGGSVPLIGALVVLVALAGVLVYLLVRPPSRRCIHCQRKNPLDVEICRFCGNPVDREPRKPETKPCPACDFENAMNALFCESCGAEFESGPITRPIGEPGADLHVVDGSAAMDGKKFDLAADGTRYKIGSLQGMDIRIVGDSTVSREHAVVCCGKDRDFYVQDIGSTNGTMVNGEKIVRQTLSDGDVIQVGKTKLRFRLLQ